MTIAFGGLIRREIQVEPQVEAPCSTCKSFGFKGSILGPDRCEFCDGTEGGQGPLQVSDSEIPLHVKVALCLGWTRPRRERTEEGAWRAEIPGGMELEVPKFHAQVYVGYLLSLLQCNLLSPVHWLPNGSRWVALMPLRRVQLDGVWQVDREDKVGSTTVDGETPSETLCNLVLKLHSFEEGRKFLLTLRNQKL